MVKWLFCGVFNVGLIQFRINDIEEKEIKKLISQNKTYENISQYCRIATFQVLKTISNPNFIVESGKLKQKQIKEW